MTRRMALTAIVALGALVVSASGVWASGVVRGVGPSAAANERAAIADAAVLLSRLSLPGAATRTQTEPVGGGSALAAPSPPSPPYPALIDAGGWWVVPAPQASVVAYIDSHHPRGSVGIGVSSNTTADTVFYFPWASKPYVSTYRELVIAVVSLPDGSTGIRADGQVGWFTPPRVVPAGRVPAPLPGSFVSPMSLSGTAVDLVLEQLSLRTGRPLGTLARLPSAYGLVPHAARDGALWMTFHRGPDIYPPCGAECLGPILNTCTGTIIRFDPHRQTSGTELRFPGSVLIDDAVPSPDGRHVAVLAKGCSTHFVNPHVLVHDLRSGRELPIGTDTARCHSLSTPAWNAAGTELVFAYGASGRPFNHSLYPSDCYQPVPRRLAIVSATRASKRILPADLGPPPPPDCSYESAVFDRTGIVAAEICGGYLHSPPTPSPNISYLVQLDNRRRVTLRLPLPVNADTPALATDPRTGNVLVSQDHVGPARANLVSTFDGRRLRLIGAYPAQQSPLSPPVIAAPW